MTTKIPQNKRWMVSNSGKVYGDLYSCHNVHFDDEGRLTLNKRPVSVYTSADDSTFNYSLAIVPYNTSYMDITNNGIFTFSASDLAVAAVSSSPATGMPETDSVNWQQRVYVSCPTSLSYYSGSWTNNVASGVLTLDDDLPHPLCVFESLNCLAVGNANKVYLLKSDHTQQGSTLTIPLDFIITSIRYRQNNLYIGTKHKYYGETKMFIWNGSGTAAQNAYGVKSNWIFSMEEYMSSIVCVTNAGQLLRFNGGGFDTLANFPVYYSQYIWQTSSGLNAGKVFNRGMVADGEILYINIDGEVEQQSNNVYPSGFLPNQPSGLWCYDPKVGLYPRSLSSADKYVDINISSINTSTNELTLATATNASTGEPCYVKTITSITGISQTYTYYVIRVSSTVIKLALTPYDAQEGNAIDLGGSIGATERLRFIQYKNIGSLTVSTYAGAVALLTPLNSAVPPFNSPVVWGSRLMSTTSSATTPYSLCILSNAINIGSFTLQRLYSPNIKDTWKKLYLMYGGLNLDSDKIIVKARTKDRFGTPSVIYDVGTWTDSRVITMTQTSKSLSAFEVGDEIVFLSGSRAGHTTHITDITNGAGTWRIGVQDEIGVAGETFYFMADTWKKIATITNASENNNEGYAEIALGDGFRSARLDIKVEMHGHEMFIEEIIPVNSYDKPIA